MIIQNKVSEQLRIQLQTNNTATGQRSPTRVGTVNNCTDCATTQKEWSWSSDMNDFINCGYIYGKTKQHIAICKCWQSISQSHYKRYKAAHYHVGTSTYTATNCGLQLLKHNSKYKLFRITFHIHNYNYR